MSDKIEEIKRRHCQLGDSGLQRLIDRAYLLAEVERLRKALAFYADQRSYRTTTVHMSGHFAGQPVMIDGGAQARKALEGGR